METETQYQPRVVRELWVPHNCGEIAFAHPLVGPNNYRTVGVQILKQNQLIPTGDQTASLVHASYLSEVENEPEFKNIRQTMKNRYFWIFNRNLWTPEGVYVLQDDKAIGTSEPLNQKNLEGMLKGGKDIKGIRFSKDRELRFAPIDSYKGGDHTPEELAEDGFMIASCGVDGAEKLGEVSSNKGYFRFSPKVWTVKADGKPIQTVSALDDYSGNRLSFGGSHDDYWDGYASGVWK